MLSWTALSAGVATGGSSVSIDNYELQYDNALGGTTNFITLNTAPSTTYTALGLTGGLTYQFRVAAINIFGEGSFSPVLSVVTAQPPETPAAPTVTQTSVYVKIAWTAPVSNNAAIDKYQILIGTSTTTYIEDTTKCDGSDSIIIG